VSKLGELVARGGAAAPPAASRLAAAIAGRQVFADVEVRGLRGKLRLVGAGRTLDIEGEVAAAMAKRGLEPTVLTQGDYETERALRTLADAVRDPDDVTKPLGAVEDWAALDVDAVAELWRAYGDLREQNDPASQPLTAEDDAAIRACLEKKSALALRCFGVRRLATWLVTTGAPPPSSPTPSASSGASSPDASAGLAMTSATDPSAAS
jgi:hypothetical protein